MRIEIELGEALDLIGGVVPQRVRQVLEERLRAYGELERISLADFASAVEHVASVLVPSGPGRFPEEDGRKVFFYAVWKHGRKSPYIPDDYAQFKRWIQQAIAAGMLPASRADLVEAMDPEMVERSAVSHPAMPSALYHFVRVL